MCATLRGVLAACLVTFATLAVNDPFCDNDGGHVGYKSDPQNSQQVAMLTEQQSSLRY